MLEGAGRVGDLRDALVADQGARQLAQHPAERLHGHGHHREQVGGGHQVAWFDGARGDAPGADGQHQEGADRRQGLDHGVEQRADDADPDVRGAQLLRAGTEPALLAVLGAERLDQQRRLEALVGDVGHVAAQPLRPGHGRGHVPLVDGVHGDRDRDDREGRERQPGVDRHQQPHGDTDHDHDAERERQRVEDAGGGLGVGGGVVQELAGGVRAVPGDRQPQVLPGQGGAVVGLDADETVSGPDAATGDGQGEREGDGAEHEAGEPDPVLGGFVAADGRDHDGVGGPADRAADGDGERAEEAGSAHGQHVDAGVGAHTAPHDRDRAAHTRALKGHRGGSRGFWGHGKTSLPGGTPQFSHGEGIDSTDLRRGRHPSASPTLRPQLRSRSRKSRGAPQRTSRPAARIASLT